MRKFARRYSAFMVKSIWVSKLGCGLLVFFVSYHLLERIEIAGPAKVSELDPAVLEALLLEAFLLISLLLRCVAVWRVQFISLWMLAASWVICGIAGLVYIFTVNGGLPPIFELFRIDILANCVFAFILLSVVRFFITAAIAFTLSLDDYDPYS